jgi:uncharacterized protein
MISTPAQPEATPRPPEPSGPQSRPALDALWNLTLYLFLLTCLWAMQQFLFYVPASHIPPPVPHSAAHYDNALPIAPYILLEAIDLLAIVFLSVFMSTLENRNVGVYGLGGEPGGGASSRQLFTRFLHGALCGLLAMSALIATLRGTHLLVFDAVLLHGPFILRAASSQLLLFLLVGIFEEYLFRGYIQFTLTRGLLAIGNRLSPRHARAIAFWSAAVLTSAIFLSAHIRNPGENWPGLLQIFLAGAVFVFALWRTGSLWWGIGFHMAWDWSQSFLYGVPDSGDLMQNRLFATHALGKPILSGGTVGPEGSILCIPVFLLVLLTLFFTHPSPQPPMEPRS